MDVFRLQLTVLLLLGGHMVSGVTVQECRRRPADLVFLLDGSGSIEPQDFTKAKSFVSDIIRKFEISSRAVHVGLIRFDSEAVVLIRLNEFRSAAQLLQKISQMKNFGGKTNTGSALQLAGTVLTDHRFGARDNVEKIVIVLTDGRSNKGVDVGVAAMSLKSKGVAPVIAVGVGGKINRAELQLIASS
ncbi:cartilage matrix protein, partial [Lingula anatina]|uniref:Cartilage matrix protein n=1 Tax=Lingula anatina TaxID=7574 RepID=A0A2R2MMD4_LINAN